VSYWIWRGAKPLRWRRTLRLTANWANLARAASALAAPLSSGAHRIKHARHCRNIRSRILKSLKGQALRPTSDYLRETLFNVLGLLCLARDSSISMQAQARRN